MISISRTEDGGRAVVIFVHGSRGSVEARVNRDFLDDAVGTNSSEEARKAYVNQHLSELEKAINATAFGGILNKQFSGIEVLKVEKSEAK